MVQIFRNDVENYDNGDTERYYTVIYNEPISCPCEFYFDIFKQTIEVDDTELLRNDQRIIDCDRYINIDGRIRDPIYLIERFTDCTIFSYIKYDKDIKKSMFVWSRMKRLIRPDETCDNIKRKVTIEKIKDILKKSRPT